MSKAADLKWNFNQKLLINQKLGNYTRFFSALSLFNLKIHVTTTTIHHNQAALLRT